MRLRDQSMNLYDKLKNVYVSVILFIYQVKRDGKRNKRKRNPKMFKSQWGPLPLSLVLSCADPWHPSSDRGLSLSALLG